MAMTTCKECKNEVSTKAKVCPHCGAPMPKRTSPLTKLFLVVVLVPIGLAIFLPDSSPPSSTPGPADKAAEERIAAAKQKGDALIGEFEADKSIILADAKVLSAEGKHQELQDKYGKYSIARDPVLDELLMKATAGINRSKYPGREQELLAELRSIPSSDTEGNLSRYKALAQSFPDVPDYRDKVAIYTEQKAAEDNERQAIAAAAEARQNRINAQFSPWDGSHRALERAVKKGLKDPDSYEHIETRYGIEGNTITVVMQYRAKNSFGGYAIGRAVAETDIDGTYLKIISSE